MSTSQEPTYDDSIVARATKVREAMGLETNDTSGSSAAEDSDWSHWEQWDNRWNQWTKGFS